MEWATTSTILAKLSDYGQEGAWAQLIARFRQPIVRYAEHLGLEAADAEDVAQETLIAFAQAYREGHYDKAKGRLKDWLFGIAHRQALNARRKVHGRRERAADPQQDQTPLEPEPAEGPLTEFWEREWRAVVYERALEKVRSEVHASTFEIFRLLIFEEHSVKAIAETLGIATTKVYNARHRVTKRLRELIAEAEDA